MTLEKIERATRRRQRTESAVSSGETTLDRIRQDFIFFFLESCYGSSPELDRTLSLDNCSLFTLWRYLRNGNKVTDTLYKDFNALHLACLAYKPNCAKYILTTETVLRPLLEVNPATGLTRMNDTGYKGHTALDFACMAGHADIVRLLLKHGADPCVGTNYGAIHIAATHGNVDCVTELLKTQPDLILSIDMLNLVAKHKAKAVNLLVSCNWGPFEQDANGAHPMHWAIATGSLEQMLAVVERQSLPICVPEQEKHLYKTSHNVADLLAQPVFSQSLTALEYACQYGYVDIVGYCLAVATKQQALADSHSSPVAMPESADSFFASFFSSEPKHCLTKYFASATAIAAKQQHYHCVELLLMHHPFHIDTLHEDQTILMMACHQGNLDAVDMLISRYNADPLVRSAKGEMVLHIAVKNKNIPLIELLCGKFGVSPNVFDYTGLTLVQYTLLLRGGVDKFEKTTLLHVLSKHGANFDCASGNFEIEYQKCHTDVERKELLTQWGFSSLPRFLDPRYKRSARYRVYNNPREVMTYSSITPLMLAYRRNLIDFIRVLVNLGADVNYIQSGHTALSYVLTELESEPYTNPRYKQDCVTLLVNCGALNVNHELVMVVKLKLLHLVELILPKVDSLSQNVTDEEEALALIVDAEIWNQIKDDPLKTFRLLVARGLNLNRQHDDKTLLYRCASALSPYGENHTIVKLWQMITALCDAGADLYLENRNGLSAFDILKNKNAFKLMKNYLHLKMLYVEVLEGWFECDKKDFEERMYKGFNQWFLYHFFGEVLIVNAILRDDSKALTEVLALYREIGLQPKFTLQLRKLLNERGASKTKRVLDALVPKAPSHASVIPAADMSCKNLQDSYLTKRQLQSWKHLKHINLTNNQLTIECLKPLSLLATEHRALQSLDLSHNKVSLVWHKKKSNRWHVVENSFSSCRQTAKSSYVIPKDVIGAYLKALQNLLGKNSSLKRLSLRSNGVCVLSAENIAKSLANNSALVELDLRDNMITQLHWVVKSLRESTNINPALIDRLAIDISGNLVSEHTLAKELRQNKGLIPAILSDATPRRALIIPCFKIMSQDKLYFPVVSARVWLVYYLSKDFNRFSTEDHATMLIEGMWRNGQRFLTKIDAGRGGGKCSLVKEPDFNAVSGCTIQKQSQDTDDLTVDIKNIELDRLESLKRSYTRYMIWARTDMQVGAMYDEAVKYKNGLCPTLSYDVAGKGKAYNCAKYLSEIAKKADIDIEFNSLHSPSCGESPDAHVLTSDSLKTQFFW